MTDSLQIRCIVCEEPFDESEGIHPDRVIGGVPITIESDVVGVASLAGRTYLRGYLCINCIFAKGNNGLIHLVHKVTEREYKTWKPMVT